MLFNVYHGYMDESGTHDNSEVVAVAGYLATYEQWNAFEKEWNEAMRYFRVDDFHMTDFEAHKAEFANLGWWTNNRRAAFMERITGICQRHTIIGLGCAIVREQYERILPQSLQEGIFRHPYYYCLYGCYCLLLGFGNRWVTASGGIERRLSTIKPVNFLFDHKPGRFRHSSTMVSWEAFAQKLHQLLKTGLDAEGKTLGELTFGKRQDYPQLRAADLLVFETARMRLNQWKNPDVSTRKSMGVLRKALNLLVTFQTEVKLRNYVRLLQAQQAGMTIEQIRASLERDDPEVDAMMQECF